MGGDDGPFAKAKTGGRSEVSMAAWLRVAAMVVVVFTGKCPARRRGKYQKSACSQIQSAKPMLRDSDAGGQVVCAIDEERVLQTVSFSKR